MSLALLQAIASHPEPLVLCTVLQVKGSAPRHAGSKMLVGREGRLLGSVGGGRGEARTLAACAERLGGEGGTLLEIDMQGLEAEGPDMVCGGSSCILVEPLTARGPYRAALERLLLGEPALLVKRLGSLETALQDATGAWLQGAGGYISQPLKAYEANSIWTSDPKHLPYRDATKNLRPAG